MTYRPPIRLLCERCALPAAPLDAAHMVICTTCVRRYGDAAAATLMATVARPFSSRRGHVTLYMDRA